MKGEQGYREEEQESGVHDILNLVRMPKIYG